VTHRNGVSYRDAVTHRNGVSYRSAVTHRNRVSYRGVCLEDGVLLSRQKHPLDF
jgi:hypothetical protein